MVFLETESGSFQYAGVLLPSGVVMVPEEGAWNDKQAFVEAKIKEHREARARKMKDGAQ